MNLSTMIAFRHLRSVQKGSFSTVAGVLSISGLAIGIAALVITFSILEGFESTISEKIAGFDGHLRIQHFMDSSLPEKIPKIDTLLAGFQIKNKIAFIQKPALLRKGALAEGVIVEGIENPNTSFGLHDIIVEGSLNLHSGSIVLGRKLADKLSLHLGDKLALFDIKSIAGLSSFQRVKQFQISGLFHSGLQDYDQSIVYISLDDAQQLFEMKDQISGLMITFDSIDNAEDVYSNLEMNLDFPMYIMSWKDKHQVLFDWIRVQRWPVLIIFGLIAFVGVVNIISALTMIMLEKMREIGIYMALGFNAKKIRNIFLIEGSIIGMAGSISGVLLALLLIWLQLHYQIITIPEDIYFMDRIPVSVNIWRVLYIGFMGMIAAVFASILSTMNIKKILPAKALRYE